MATVSRKPARMRAASTEVAAITTGVFNDQQVAGQIAAIHRGNIPRLQRPQSGGVVPVHEMPAKPFHLVQSGEGFLQPLDCLAVPIQPKSRAASTEHQIAANIGRATCGARDGRLGTSWKLSGGKALSCGVTKVSKTSRCGAPPAAARPGILNATCPDAVRRGATGWPSARSAARSRHSSRKGEPAKDWSSARRADAPRPIPARRPCCRQLQQRAVPPRRL